MHVQYEIYGAVSEKGWIKELSLLTMDETQLKCYVSTNQKMKQGCFRLIRSRGTYCYMYCDENYVVFKPVGRRVALHSDPTLYPGTSLGPVISSGYHNKSINMFISKNIISVPSTQDCTIHTPSILANEMQFVNTLASNNSGNVREARSNVIPAVTLVMTRSKNSKSLDSRLLAELNIRLLIRIVDLCLKHSNEDHYNIITATFKLLATMMAFA